MTLTNQNPFAEISELPFQLPDFSAIRDEHYLPAFLAGCEAQLLEVEQILAQSDVTFENTILALERSGQLLSRVLEAFYNKSSADTNPEIDRIETEIAPKLAQHEDAIRLNPALFARIKTLFEKRDQLNLDAESAWLIERYHRDFVHAGAALDDEARKRLSELNEQLSILSTKFDQNLHSDSNELAIWISDVAMLEGLSSDEISSAAAAAASRGEADKWLITMVNYTGNPLLASLKNRELRKQIMQAALAKGGRDNGFDNKQTLLEMARLRAQRANLLGFASHAEYVLDDETAKNPRNVHKLFERLVPAAVRNANAEAKKLAALALELDGITDFASWDWDYYAQILKQREYSVDTSAMRPYFDLDRVLFDGVFFAANKLFGLSFVERKDLVGYHPDVRVFEVKNRDAASLGLFLGDFYTRDSKRGGAWMNALVNQNELLGQLPVIVNNLNVPKPAVGKPTLLTFDETSTLFHEFGHALHGLLSSVTYPRFSGTNVQRDFVEFPSQVNEMWMLWPEVLEHYSKHVETGEPLPAAWVANLKAAEQFNQGFETTAYLAAAVLDLAWHSLGPDEIPTDVVAFEEQALANYGIKLELVPTRYRSTYFGHIFAGGYSAGYYGYIWSEVLDADTVEWFKLNGGLNAANGEHFRDKLLSRGGSLDSMEMFREFRGRDAEIQPLLTRRGLN